MFCQIKILVWISSNIVLIFGCFKPIKVSNSSDDKSVVDDKDVNLACMPFHVDDNDISLIGKKNVLSN